MAIEKRVELEGALLDGQEWVLLTKEKDLKVRLSKAQYEQLCSRLGIKNKQEWARHTLLLDFI